MTGRSERGGPFSTCASPLHRKSHAALPRRALGETAKLRYASRVQSRRFAVNGIPEISACVCILRVHVCACVGRFCECMCAQTASPPSSGFVICEGRAEALLACARVFAPRISLCTRVLVTASAREHGETLFAVFLLLFFSRRLDCMTAADVGA